MPPPESVVPEPRDGERVPLAYHDRRFMDSDAARPLRILAEYLHPYETFRREQVRDTIVFFGSARLTPGGPLDRYWHEARELARLVTEWSTCGEGSEACFVVSTGGGPGIMEAANRGAQDAGGRSIGLNIGLPHEQRPNPFITPELTFEFNYFFMRKLWFAYLARAVIFFPGGFGTLDEMFEMLMLAQTGKLARTIPLLLYGPDYWNRIVDFTALARHGVISPSDLDLFRIVDSPAEAIEILKREIPPEPARGRPAVAKSITREDPGRAPRPSVDRTPRPGASASC